jgi:hypothetical protein
MSEFARIPLVLGYRASETLVPVYRPETRAVPEVPGNTVHAHRSVLLIRSTELLGTRVPDRLVLLIRSTKQFTTQIMDA